MRQAWGWTTIPWKQWICNNRVITYRTPRPWLRYSSMQWCFISNVLYVTYSIQISFIFCVNYYLHYVLALDVPLFGITWDCLGCPLVLDAFRLWQASTSWSVYNPTPVCQAVQVCYNANAPSVFTFMLDSILFLRPSGSVAMPMQQARKLLIKRTSAIPLPHPTIPHPPSPDTNRRTKSQAQHATVKSWGNLRRLKLRGVCCSPIFVWF
jgi:hypothetical protein